MQAVGRFESFGINAEFAVVQRRCGVSAPGIFAWAQELALDDLLRLLVDGFAGLFDSDNIDLTDGDVLFDRRYNMRLPVAPGAGEEGAASEPVRLGRLLREQTWAKALLAGTLARLQAGGVFCLYKTPAPMQGLDSNFMARAH